jgi:prepilin-type N-terminal cleavage/methylation domain-containing protein
VRKPTGFARSGGDRTMATQQRQRAFTIVEILVVVSIISMLIAILLPAVGKARDNARLTVSKSNLRQLGLAHATYGSDWNDRQLTLVDGSLANYGKTIQAALSNFNAQHAGSGPNGHHPPIMAGWGAHGAAWAYWMDQPANGAFLLPINFSGSLQYYGWWRNINFKVFNHYVSGRFYDPVFWAPKDEVALTIIEEECASLPFEFEQCHQGENINFVLPSYVLSPAALFSPDVFSNPQRGGFKNPLSLPGGLRVPTFGQVRYADLKTQIMEHHWLQNTRAECNANFQPGNFDGCEPYYFNHGFESVPMVCFYDGHVQGLGVSEAMGADARLDHQVGWGLWSRDTPWGADGYLISDGWDLLADTSFNVLTTDGILGRDTIGE